MKQTARVLLVCMLAALLAAGCALLYRWDNKYTAALPGWYGVSVLTDSSRPGFLVDGWAYFPGELLGPEDFAAGRTAEQYTYIGEHANFSDFLGSPYGTATYRLLLATDGEPAELTLYLPELLCAGRVYIDGRLAGEQGSVQPYDPLVEDGLYTFTAGRTTEIIIQCANYTHYYSGMYYPPAIGSPEAISRMLAVRLFVYGLLCFVPLAIALSHLAQWLLARDKLARYMGILCFAFALRMCYPFVRLLGLPLVRPLYALEDLCGNVVLLCAILLAGGLSGAARRRYHRSFAVPSAAALCAVSVVFPLFVLPLAPLLINFYSLLLFAWKAAAGVYLLLLARRTVRQAYPLGRCLLTCAGIYGLSVLASVLTINRFEPICGAWPEEYGAFVLVGGFTALMVSRGVHLLRENRVLSLHLQEEVDRKTRGMETLLAERRELLGNLLHDVKNPLAALRSYAELVRSGGVALDQETAGYLDALTERVGAVEKRLRLIQDFSRGERDTLCLAPLCVNELLRVFYEQYLPDIELYGPDFTLSLPDSPLWVRADRDRLWTALENLCFNALSFCPADALISIALAQDAGFAAISVRDTGVGIAPEDLPHIFTKGFTRRPDDDGEGLGLFIVRMIALEHNGNIEASSVPGQGSVFTLRLPLLEDGGA